MKPQTKPNDVASKLRAAKALIADEAHWCQGDFHKDERSCSFGAILVVVPCWEDVQPTHSFLQAAAKELGFDGRIDKQGIRLDPAVYLNDHTDHATVMRMFDRAIELAEAQAVAGVA